MSGHQRPVFDQGLGRSLWFVQGADVERVADAVAAFPAARRADLWSGIGLAATYAGGASEDGLTFLQDRAGELALHLAQGSAFAAEARIRAGNATADTEAACRSLTGLPAREAAQVTVVSRRELSHGSPEPAYAVWRRRIRETLADAAGEEAAVA